MSSLDSSDITLPASSSRLLSESPMFPLSSHTGPGGDDLSISELSLSDRTVTFQKPFSLLASSRHEPSHDEEGGENLDGAASEGRKDDDLERADELEKAEQKRHAARLRDEKLQSDIFILKKLNASFALFNEALQDVGSANQVCYLMYIYTQSYYF
jgi:hypothetical protein